jgi:hypothetical protein
MRKYRLPKIFITDGSLALMNAICEAFLNMTTILDYSKYCYSMLNEQLTPPEAEIRNDICHFANEVSRWQCFKSCTNPMVKTFYMKVIGNLLTVSEWFEVQDILKHITVVAGSKTQGNIERDEQHPCSKSKEALLNFVRGKIVDKSFVEADESQPSGTYIFM